MEKQCTVCRKFKDIEDFHKQKGGLYNKSAACKMCRSLEKKEYLKNNLQKVRGQKEKWRQEHSEQISIFTKNWYRSHRDKKLAQGKEWFRNHPEKVRIKDKKHKLLHPERRKAREAVNHAIRSGRLQPAKNFPCTNCLVEKASQYHHWKGYEPENWLEVIPLCVACHRD